MNKTTATALAAIALSMAMGCSSTSVSNRQSDIGSERFARPDHIWVYDFAATAADLPPESSGASAISSTPPSAKELETGRKLGAEVAHQLVGKILAMGLPGAIASDVNIPKEGDIVIRGYFASIEEGSEAKRLVVGFGSGKADLRTMVEGFLVTSTGLRKLGSGEVDSGGGKTPGLLVPLAVTVATANPVGLLVGGAVKGYGELSGKDTIEGAAERTAQQIADELEPAFKKQGWI
jgi:hypothetical protein